MPPTSRLRPVNAGERRVSLQREYVAAGNSYWYKDRLILPWSFDEVTADFGFDIYERMKLDSQVAACLTFFKASIVEDGLNITSAITDDTADGYKRAGEINDKARRMFDAMETSLDEVAWDMLDCMVFGNRVGELVYAIQGGELNVSKIKVKPVKSIGYVVDKFLNILGLVAMNSNTGALPSNVDPKNVLPREKFLIMTFRTKDSDPRGTSILRAAYDPWWRKRQILPDYLKYLSQFASPSLIGYTSEGATIDEEDDPAVDDDGNILVSVQQIMAQALTEFKNGSVATFPFGAKVDTVQSEGDGLAFLNAIGQSNLEITKAILTQQLATEEGEHMARAAATVHQDVLNTLIRQGKRMVARSIGVDILRRWVGYNWGPEALPLTPRATLGTIEYKDMASVMQAISALVRASYFVDEQMPAVDKILGLPIRTADQMEKKHQQEKELKAPQQQAASDPEPEAEPEPARPTPIRRGANNAR